VPRCFLSCTVSGGAMLRKWMDHSEYLPRALRTMFSTTANEPMDVSSHHCEKVLELRRSAVTL